MCQHNLPCSIVYAHCLLPGRAFASLYVLLFLEKEAVFGGHAMVYIFDHICCLFVLSAGLLLLVLLLLLLLLEGLLSNIINIQHKTCRA